ncbi:MAG: glycosyltransferase family 4 protein [Deltaproteobacteria bacterium]|nr:glycosyltransferase family 4 protein [Deltaproteobacteria bacterium]
MQDEKPRILIVAFEVVPSPTGASATIGDLLRGMSPVFEVDLLSVHAPGMAHVQKYFGARVFRVPVGKGTFLARAEKFRRAVIRQLESTPYDVVHYFSLWGAYPVIESGVREFKTVYHVESLESLDLKYHYPELRHDRRLSRTIQARESMGLEMSDKVVAVTGTGYKYLLELGVEEDRLALIRPGVDPTLFKPGSEGTFNRSGIVYAGSMAPWQGISTALFAYAKVHNMGSDFSFRLYSPTVQRWAEPLLGIAEQELIRSKVEFCQPVSREKLPPYLQEAVVGLAPLTRTDRNQLLGCSPLRLLEYMASGLAIVTSRLPSNEEIIDDNKQGIFFTPGEPGELADKLKWLLDDQEAATRLGLDARKRLCKDFNIGRFWEAWLKLYSELLEISKPALEIPAEFFGADVKSVEKKGHPSDHSKGTRHGSNKDVMKNPDDNLPWDINDPGFEVVELDVDSGPSVIGEILETEGSTKSSNDSFESVFEELDAEVVGNGPQDGAINPAGEPGTLEHGPEEGDGESNNRKSRLKSRYYAKEGLLDTLLGTDLDSHGEDDEE